MGTSTPSTRLGILVPSSNSNAEGITAQMLKNEPDLSVHYTRFPLPTDLDEPFNVRMLGTAPALLRDAEVRAVALHGTAGSWTGLAAERNMCGELSEAVHAEVTTASMAMIAGLHALAAKRISLVFLAPAGLVPAINSEYSQHGIEVVGASVAETAMSNQEIGHLDQDDIAALMRPAFDVDADAVVCVGTNLRSGYLVTRFEEEFGIPVVDSASATLWHLLRIAGVARPIPGWGRLLETV